MYYNRQITVGCGKVCAGTRGTLREPPRRAHLRTWALPRRLMRTEHDGGPGGLRPLAEEEDLEPNITSLVSSTGRHKQPEVVAINYYVRVVHATVRAFIPGARK